MNAMTKNSEPTRAETDLIGPLEIPASAYYGVNTARAADNFQLTADKLHQEPALINALALVKQAAATSNADIGALDRERADAIVKACEDIRSGQLHDQFILDLVQGGAGTSTNMNANEVIANRGLEHLGHQLGEYEYLHPLNDVNMGQSTNDVYPTALKIALHDMLDDLLESLQYLREAISAKAKEFSNVIKMGRTQMQDAVPMTLGEEFQAWSGMLQEDERAIRMGRAELERINLGGTAIGTALNAHEGYRERAVEVLREISGIPELESASDLVQSTQDTGAFVFISGILKRYATRLSVVANDLRLLSSGPRAGLNEINLPARQAGSSIMPGKVNPVIPEAVNQVCFTVMGNDLTVSMASEAGQLQLNAFEPVMARALFSSIKELSRACRMLADKCITGITANTELLRERVEESAGLATIFSPVIGYKAATQLAIDATKTGVKVTDLAVQRELLTQEQVQELIAEALHLQKNN